MNMLRTPAADVLDTPLNKPPRGPLNLFLDKTLDNFLNTRADSLLDT
jgi:hypothetical protein